MSKDDVRELFSDGEWSEIQHEIRKLPETDRFTAAKTVSELRNVLETTSYRDMNEPYNREKHYDAE
ncbi:hypothetical protein BC938DRAFT_476692 [Jimgerdemannia flammicorona]|uniref:Uncharacterized protein n=1 Tax=Jimgerdemannia flammicorona TaxID=994334 RepID=A0A433PF35_9FUNG|nr:hypothetical protein BC938DRAFT_476692 [Jimgerdemannia flammicorona]